MGFYNNLCPGCMNEIGDAENCPYCGFDTNSKQSAPYIAYGTVLAGKYVVGEVLEQNSEGVTYLGLDTITNNCVRIREFLPENICLRYSDELKPEIKDGKINIFKKLKSEFLDMWHKIMKLKTLESMITVLDVFEANDTAYAIAEADGNQTLSDYLKSKNGFLSWSEITDKIFPVLEALEALHNADIIHGAISPDTLFLCGNGKFKLWGFSINEIRKTDGNIPVDIKPGYAAIEQYSNDMQLSTATDVYGFIAVLFRCITGSMPIDAELRSKEDTLSIPAIYARDLPDYILAAYIGALQVYPEDRTSNIALLKKSFTKEAFEQQKRTAAALSAASLIDPISDIKTSDLSTKKVSDPVVVNKTPAIPVISKDMSNGNSTSVASTIILSISIIVIMIIFFVCLTLTGIISFNVGGASENVVEMPNFENYQKDDSYIVQVAEKYGLKITLQPASSSTVGQGIIFEQDIAPGTKIARGSDVTLTYSKGFSTVTLPDFTGIPFTETVYYLGKLNLSYNIIEKQNTGNNKPGTVAVMTPAAGSVVYEETEITIEIWGEPPTQSAPNTNSDTTGNSTGSEITSSTSILDSIFGRLSDSVSGIGNTIQNFFN